MLCLLEPNIMVYFIRVMEDLILLLPQMDWVSLLSQQLQEIPQMFMWQLQLVARASVTVNWNSLTFSNSGCGVNSASQINIVSDSDGLYLVAEGDLHH